jgi:DNA polymerase III subunit gamma/tau
LNLCNDCDIHYKTARNKRLHVEMSLIKMTYIHRMTDGLRAALEKKTPDVSTHTPQLVQNVEKGVQTAVPKAILLPMTPTILSIEAAEKAIEIEEKEKAKIISKLSFENLKIAWEKYGEQTPSESTRTAMKAAKVELQDKKVIAKVGSNVSASILQTEGLKLLDFLKTELLEAQLSVHFMYDESLAPKVQVVEVASKPTAPRAILIEMMKSNPLVRDFALKLNLKPDE